MSRYSNGVRRSLRVRALAAVAMAMCLSMAGGTATASSDDKRLLNRQTTPMQHHKVMAVWPTERGATARLDDGRTISMPAQTYTKWQQRIQAGARPLDEVPGSCGTSFIELYDVPGSGDYEFSTGYDLVTGVWYSQWWTVVNGAGTTSYEQEFYDYDGGNQGSWSTEHSGTVPGSDLYQAAVDPPSYAFVTPLMSVCPDRPTTPDTSFE